MRTKYMQGESGNHGSDAQPSSLPELQEQKAKLREEYLSLGGSANSPIPNYFLYIIIGETLSCSAR